MNLEKKQFNVNTIVTAILVVSLVIFGFTGAYLGKLEWAAVFGKLYEAAIFMLGWFLRDRATNNTKQGDAS